MIPFNITLNSGVSVAPQKANIKAQDPHYTNIDALHLMIKKRTDIRSLMVDYDDSTSNVTVQSGSAVTKRELTIADSTAYNKSNIIGSEGWHFWTTIKSLIPPTRQPMCQPTYHRHITNTSTNTLPMHRPTHYWHYLVRKRTLSRPYFETQPTLCRQDLLHGKRNLNHYHF